MLKNKNKLLKKLDYFKKLVKLMRTHSPAKTFIMGFMALFLSLAIAALIYFSVHDYNLSEKLNTLPELNYAQFSDKIQKDELPKSKTYILYHIFGPPTYFQTYQNSLEVEYKANFLGELKDDKDLQPHVKMIQVLPPVSNYGQARTAIIAQTIFLVVFGSIIISAQMIVSEIIAGKNFSPAKINLTIKFSDIVGYDDVKKEFLQLKEYFENKKLYKKANVNLPRGILLTGNPGVGKTMFAKALANELNCNFLLASGSDFVEMYVGVGAKRVRGLFNKARMLKPTIIFIDEIDAIGSRSFGFTDSERLATINQLLAEMDGVIERYDVLVVGATNFPEKLDAALLRPGRFDKKIHIPLPDLQTRQDMILYYLNKHKFEKSINIKNLAIRINGSTGADINNFIEGANILAFERDPSNPIIIEKDLIKALENLALGTASHKNTNEIERKRVAYHELGHAVAVKKLLPSYNIEKVSIIGKGMALGFTWHNNTEEKKLYTKPDLEKQISVLLGGRAAEDVFFGDVSNGAQDDLEKANVIALNMVSKWGMGDETGLMVFNSDPARSTSSPYIEQMKAEEIRKILNKQYEKIKNIILEEKVKMEGLCIALLEKEELSGDEIVV